MRDYNRDRRWLRTFLIDIAKPGEQPKLIWERSIRDRYRDPGSPLMRTLANGKRVLRQQATQFSWSATALRKKASSLSWTALIWTR